MGIDKTPCIALEQKDNLLFVRSPNMRVFNEVCAFLTFTRTVREKKEGRFIFSYSDERCFEPSLNDPFVIICPAGFKDMLIRRFNEECHFTLSCRRDRRIVENTKPDWSLLDPSVVFRSGQREILEKMGCGRHFR